MRRFYLHMRAGIYYAELVDQVTGKKLPAKSTGERNEDEARDVVHEWLRTEDITASDAERIAEAPKARGLLLTYTTPGSLGAELFTDFLTRFWTYDKSHGACPRAPRSENE